MHTRSEWLAPIGNHPTITLLKTLDSNGQRFAEYCTTNAQDRATYNWNDPITGQPIAHVRYRVGEWICTCTWEGGELTEWGYSHITADN
jgi:hypothetical protein